jgi:hypothetical protein
LGVQNIDKLVVILKNWPSGVRTNCPSFATMRMVEFLKTKNKMLDNFEEELEDVGYFDSFRIVCHEYYLVAIGHQTWCNG